MLEERKEEFKKSRKSEINSISAGGETGVVDYVMERRAGGMG